MAARTCSECQTSLAGRPPQSKTCGSTCRQKRARRTRKLDKAAKREADERTYASPELQEIITAARDTSGDVVKKVIQQELAPIVREALTESTLQAIDDLLKLTPRAVAALGADIDDYDPVIRQRAYSLALKYTIGHPALVRPDDSLAPGQMVVNFNLPRPDFVPGEAQDVDTTAVRECDLCLTEKPEADFVGNSNRCQECQDRWKRDVETAFAKP